MKSFTPLQLSRFRTHYARMQVCGPLQRSTIRAILHQCEDAAIQQLAEAGIEHMSLMARAYWYERLAETIRSAPALPTPRRVRSAPAPDSP